MTLKIEKTIFHVMNPEKLIPKLIESGLTQVQIAQECGCSQPNISDLQNGKIKNPSYDIGCGLVRLAEKHGITIPDQPKRTDK